MQEFEVFKNIQCNQVWLCLKNFGDNFCYKSIPNIGYFGAILKNVTQLLWLLFSGTVGKFGLLLIATSGQIDLV